MTRSIAWRRRPGSVSVISPQDINSNTATKPGGKRPAEAQEKRGVTRRTILWKWVYLILFVCCILVSVSSVQDFRLKKPKTGI